MALKALGAFQLWTAFAYGKSMIAMWQKNVTREFSEAAALRPHAARDPQWLAPSDFYAEAAATAGKHQSLSHLHSRQILYKLEDGGRSPAFNSLMLSG